MPDLHLKIDSSDLDKIRDGKVGSPERIRIVAEAVEAGRAEMDAYIGAELRKLACEHQQYHEDALVYYRECQERLLGHPASTRLPSPQPLGTLFWFGHKRVTTQYEIHKLDKSTTQFEEVTNEVRV